MSRKLLLQDAHGQREFLLVGTLIVGRDPRCEISANDPLLSRQHAEFVETPHGVLVRDLHSQNGIKVNDIAVKEAQLQSGDTIQIARMNLRFVDDVPEQAKVASPGADDDRTQVLQAPQFGKSATPPAPAAHVTPIGSKPAAAPPGAPDATPPLGVPTPALRPASPMSGADGGAHAASMPPRVPSGAAPSDASHVTPAHGAPASSGAGIDAPAASIPSGVPAGTSPSDASDVTPVRGVPAPPGAGVSPPAAAMPHGVPAGAAPPDASHVTPVHGAPGGAAAPKGPASSPSATAVPPLPAEDDRTNVIKRPVVPPAAAQAGVPPAQAKAPAHAAATPSADGTLMMPSPLHATAPASAHARGATSPPASAPPHGAQGTPASAATSRGGADDARGRSASASASAAASSAAPAAAAAGVSARGAAAAVAKTATPGAAAIEESAPDSAAAKQTMRKPRGSWAARVLLRVLMLGLVCSLVAAVPLMFWHEQQVSTVGLSRATALGNWFAAEASAALERSSDAGAAVQALQGEPGVVAARVLTPDGHVIAPASRAAEVVSAVPAVGVAPSEILHQQWARNGDLLEVAQPVRTSKDPRAAIVWLTVNPATEYGGSSLVIVAPAVVVAMFVAWIIAMSITRPTLRALGHLNEDVELALSGRLDGVTDPLGAKPVKELTDTISYLAARIRTTGLDVSADRRREGPSVITSVRPGSAPSPAAPSSASAVAAPRGNADAGASANAGVGSSANAGARSGSDGRGVSASPASASSSSSPQVVAVPPTVGGCLVVDTAFRVVSADARCADLLDATVDTLVGRHLLDAISDRVLVDAVLGCLSALPPEGARETTATDATGRNVAVTVSRTGKDQPVSITLRAEARLA